MIPTDDGCDVDTFWGRKITTGQLTIRFDQIPAHFGNKNPLTTYNCQTVDVRVVGPTLLMKDLNVFTMINDPGNSPILWEYRPQVCVLKCSEPYPYYRS